MSFVYITHLCDDHYSLAAATLVYSVRKTGTTNDIIIVSPEKALSPKSVSLLTLAGAKVLQVSASKNPKIVIGGQIRHNKACQYSMFQLWNLKHVKKMIYLSADTLVLKSIDHLFDKCSSFCAHGDRYPGVFNTGVMIFTPSIQNYASLIERYEGFSFYNSDHEEILNTVFGKAWAQQPSQHLSPNYNFMTSYKGSSYTREVEMFDEIHIIHYTSRIKPWNIVTSKKSSTDIQSISMNYHPDLYMLWLKSARDLVYSSRQKESSSSTQPSTNSMISGFQSFFNKVIVGEVPEVLNDVEKDDPVKRLKSAIPFFPIWTNGNRYDSACTNENNFKNGRQFKNKFSVLISTFDSDRWELCTLLIDHYGRSNYVDRIFITLHNPNTTAPALKSTSELSDAYDKPRAVILMHLDTKLILRTEMQTGFDLSWTENNCTIQINDGWFRSKVRLRLSLKDQFKNIPYGNLVLNGHFLATSLYTMAQNNPSAVLHQNYVMLPESTDPNTPPSGTTIELAFTFVRKSKSSCISHDLEKLSMINRTENSKKVCRDSVRITIIRARNVGTAPKDIFFLPNYGYNTLNNRFNPTHLIRTEAMLMIDDDIRVSIPDVDFAFAVWKSHPERIVGPYKRHFRQTADNRNVYEIKRQYNNHPVSNNVQYEDMDPRVTALSPVYDAVLTKFFFARTEYLWLYTCVTPPGAHWVVDQYVNGEDILFNLVVSSFTGLGPLGIAIKVDDFGSTKGISLSKSHSRRRTKVLDALINLFEKQSYGGTVGTIGTDNAAYRVLDSMRLSRI